MLSGIGARGRRVRASAPTAKARELRRSQTTAEEKLWEALRGRRLLGLKFRRQTALQGYIVDFCCHEELLVVEVDGEVHSDPRQIAHDENRDAHLESLGYQVLRFPNQLVFDDIHSVLLQIAHAAGLSHLFSPVPFSPSPGGREGVGEGAGG